VPVDRRGSDDLLERLSWLMATRGLPDHVRSDNGSKLTAKGVRAWLGRVDVKTRSIAGQSLAERLRGKPQRHAA
jgi:putative transposase